MLHCEYTSIRTYTNYAVLILSTVHFNICIFVLFQEEKTKSKKHKKEKKKKKKHKKDKKHKHKSKDETSSSDEVCSHKFSVEILHEKHYRSMLALHYVDIGL